MVYGTIVPCLYNILYEMMRVLSLIFGGVLVKLTSDLCAWIFVSVRESNRWLARVFKVLILLVSVLRCDMYMITQWGELG